MKLFERLARKRGYMTPDDAAKMKRKAEIDTARLQYKRILKRSFDAAQISRLTSKWTASSLSADQDVYRNLAVLRARSRDLSYNNDYAKKFLQMVSTNVVGPAGFTLQVRSTDPQGTLDAAANKAIEAAFAVWAKRGVCDVSGKLSFCDIQRLAIKAVARDGEALIRKIYGKKTNSFGFALQILDIDRLNIQLNEERPNGNLIKMGVEITSAGKPVAYWLTTNHPGDNFYYAYEGTAYERVPAEDIYHIFIPDRPEQTRGIPWMHSAMVRIENLGGYEEAAVIAARVGASKMGFFTSPDGDGAALAEDEDQDGNLMTEADPGKFDILPEGYDFQSFDPDYPHSMFGDFIKATLRGASAGFGVAYNGLSGDLENVNFSSIRSGTIDERDNWMVTQNWFSESFHDDVYSTWLKFALLNSQIKLASGALLPVTKYDKFNTASWQGRRWQWVDPNNDMKANLLAVQNGLKSRTDVIAEQGKDINDVWAQLAAEKKMAEDMGIDLTPTQPPKNAADPAPADV